MIIVAPFRKVVRELQARSVCGCIFEVNHNKLAVLIIRQEEWRLAGWLQAHQVAVLGLFLLGEAR